MIKIYTFATNRLDFIDLQLQSFHKHLKGSFDYTVFNNARYDITGGADYDGIHRTCEHAGVRVIDIPRDMELVGRCQAIEAGPVLAPSGQYANANVAHAYALRWAWENVISKEKGPILILDSDVFLVQPVDLEEALGSHQLLNIADGKPRPAEPDRPILYMWPTFVLANMDTLPDAETLNWWCGRIEDVPVDVGGQTYHYFQAHPDLDVVNLRHLHSYYLDESSCEVHPANYDEFYIGETIILHYRSGSNWNHQTAEFHRKKTEWLKRRIEEGK